MLKALTISLCIALASAAQAFTQCNTMPLSGAGALIAEEGDNPVTWSNYVYAGYTLNGQVAVAVSSDAGQAIGTPVIVYSGTARVDSLRLGVSYQHVYALWQKHSSSADELMFAASQDHGTTWKVVDLGPQHAATLSQMTEDATNVHVAYFLPDNTPAVRTSTDAGRTFSAAVPIGPSGIKQAEMVVKSLGGNVYVAWNMASTKSEVLFAVSHDNGATFASQDLSASRPSGANEPIIGLDNISGRLSMVWREDTPLQGVYMQSRDNGDTWSPLLVLDQPARQFMVADDGTYIYVSYLRSVTTNGHVDWEVSLTVSGDGGMTFSKPKNLSGPTGISTLTNDNQRPIPWAWDGNGAFRLTGVEADGVHIWNGRNGAIAGTGALGPGILASPARNSALWLDPSGVATYGVCN